MKGYTEQEEGFLISKSIHDTLFSDNAKYSDFVVLYRTNAQSRAIEEALRKDNMPYKIYAGHSFYDRAEVKAVLAYFQLALNEKDDEAFKRVINIPARGIGQTTMQRLVQAGDGNRCSLFEAACLPYDRLEGYGLKKAVVDKIREFCKFISLKSTLAENTDAYALALSIANESGLLASMATDTTLEGISRFENVQELLNSVKEFTEDEAENRKETAEEGSEAGAEIITLGEFLENIALLSDTDKEESEEDANRITLMTVHASKGLEFPYVYVAGMEESLFPSSMAATSAEIEEERRLFYVAITRAEKKVALSYSVTRFKWGQHTSNPPSRFLRDIDPKYLDRPDLAKGPSMNDFLTGADDKEFGGGNVSRSGGNSRGDYGGGFSRGLGIRPSRPAPSVPHFTPRPPEDPNFKPDPVTSLSVGQRVEHDRFGEGVIVSMEGTGPAAKAEVDFKTGGKKILLLKYAKLRILK